MRQFSNQVEVLFSILYFISSKKYARQYYFMQHIDLKF